MLLTLNFVPLLFSPPSPAFSWPLLLVSLTSFEIHKMQHDKSMGVCVCVCIYFFLSLFTHFVPIHITHKFPFLYIFPHYFFIIIRPIEIRKIMIMIFWVISLIRLNYIPIEHTSMQAFHPSYLGINDAHSGFIPNISLIATGGSSVKSQDCIMRI